jgi:hypothetical protein
LALVASVLYGTGAHWAALQSVAWAGMIATRVSESSWAESITSTFSGENPCRFCKMVDKGSKSDQGPTLLRSVPGVDLIVSVAAHLNAVLSVNTPAVLPLPSVRCLSSRPFVPPPKTVLPA